MERPKPDIHQEAGRAFQEGRRAGRDLRSQASECPYPHRQLAERLQWMDGFAKGRKQVAQGSQAD